MHEEILGEKEGNERWNDGGAKRAQEKAVCLKRESVNRGACGGFEKKRRETSKQTTGRPNSRWDAAEKTPLGKPKVKHGRGNRMGFPKRATTEVRGHRRNPTSGEKMSWYKIRLRIVGNHPNDHGREAKSDLVGKNFSSKTLNEKKVKDVRATGECKKIVEFVVENPRRIRLGTDFTKGGGVRLQSRTLTKNPQGQVHPN